jgi:diadenosine tetraphosphate (Ap4A) HIT family hydrolase
MTSDACVLCERACRLDADDPGWLLRSDRWAVSVHPAVAVPGWVAIQTVRHTEGLADLNAAEAADLGPLLYQVSQAVTQVTGSRRVYTYSLGEGCPHTHILLGPPGAGLRGSAFIGALFNRDESLVDEAAAKSTATALADELTTGAIQSGPSPRAAGIRRDTN